MKKWKWFLGLGFLCLVLETFGETTLDEGSGEEAEFEERIDSTFKAMRIAFRGMELDSNDRRPFPRESHLSRRRDRADDFERRGGFEDHFPEFESRRREESENRRNGKIDDRRREEFEEKRNHPNSEHRNGRTEQPEDRKPEENHREFPKEPKEFPKKPEEPKEDQKPEEPKTEGPLLRQRSLWEYCSRIGQKPIQLGDCSSTFIKCEENSIRLEHCPTGRVFVDGNCEPADEQSACFDAARNQLNHATEKLVEATGFCSTNSPPGFIHISTNPLNCSRQALICGGQAGVVTIACQRESILNTETLKCVVAERSCKQVGREVAAPVKTHLERHHCSERKRGGDVHAIFRDDSLHVATHASRCQDWFLTCRTPTEAEFVFCGTNHIFDRELANCRTNRFEDHCPLVFDCRSFEWRIIPFGKCRSEFIFCKGLTPIQFQCKSGFVFREEKCIREETCGEEEPPVDEGDNHKPDEAENEEDSKELDSNEKPAEEEHGKDECIMNQRKIDSSNCTRFYRCEKNEHRRLHWQQYQCVDDYGFDPHTLECSLDFRCRDKPCADGEAFEITCGELFLCNEGRFEKFICPSSSKYSVDEKQCVFDEECDRPAEEQCSGESPIESKDCMSYGECVNGKIQWKPCRGSDGEYHSSCPGCSHPITESKEASSEPTHWGVNSIETDLDPSQPTQSVCVTGEVALGENQCGRFLRCYGGQWILVLCQEGKFFSPETRSCTADECKSPDDGSYLPPSGDQDAPEEETCSATEHRECCTKDSPKRKIAADCQRYAECDEKTHRYRDAVCPYGQHFDVERQKCVDGNECAGGYNLHEGPPLECINGQLELEAECGHAKICLEGNWVRIKCRDNAVIVDGKCSEHLKCEKKEEDSVADCNHGETKRHPYSCNKYMICEYGVFIEHTCAHGALFDPALQRCHLKYECDYPNQPKCYEGQLNDVQEDCHSFVRCVEGSYRKERCPEHHRFNDTLKTCVFGKCGNEADHSNGNYAEGNGGSDGGNGNHHHHGGGGHWKPSDGCAEDPSNGYHIDPKHCNRFYQCANGVWVPKDCPAGTVWNELITVCDWPRNVPRCRG